MPIDDSNVSHEKDGAFNEDYCKWCYADGEYTLDFFEKYRGLGGKEKFEEFKQQLIREFCVNLTLDPRSDRTHLKHSEEFFKDFSLRSG